MKTTKPQLFSDSLFIKHLFSRQQHKPGRFLPDFCHDLPCNAHDRFIRIIGRFNQNEKEGRKTKIPGKSVINVPKKSQIRERFIILRDSPAGISQTDAEASPSSETAIRRHSRSMPSSRGNANGFADGGVSLAPMPSDDSRTKDPSILVNRPFHYSCRKSLQKCQKFRGIWRRPR